MTPSPVRPSAPDRGRRPRRRLPAAVLVAAGALALEAAALLLLAVDAVLQFGSGGLPLGTRVFLVAIYLILAAWVGVAAAGMLRGRGWSRGAAVAVQLFGAVLGWWLVSIGAGPLGVGLLAVSTAGLLAVFTRSASAHLRQADAEG